MTAKELLAETLREKGFAGLCGEYGCCCFLDDFIPCGEDCADCRPAYKMPPTFCEECPAREGCEGYEDGKVSTDCMALKKPEESTP
jgi:hypothetical protein